MTNTYAWLPSLLLCGITILVSTPAIAQITPDNTLGAESSRLTPNVTLGGENGDRIDGGATRGSNLFHSFSQFNVDDGQRVYFGNPAGIQNIVSRVTGGNASNILGTLGVDGGANLFLLNPNGIIFGQNASLDLRGSFVGTTANSIGFGEQGFFSATDPNSPPLLTVNPSALLYTQINRGAIDNPGQILVQGDGQGTRTTTDLIDTPNGLRLGSNQTLALVGGDLVLAGGTLKSTGGRIELGSVGADSLVGLVPSANGWALDYEGVQNFRDIQLSQQATVDASGIGGGDVHVQGRRITLKEGSQIEASTLGFQSGGTLEVTSSESIEIDGSGSSGLTGLFAQVYTGAKGNAGNIALKTGSLFGSNGARIDSSTYGQGNGGLVSINADSITFDGFGSNGFLSQIYSSVYNDAIANSGNIDIKAGSLALTNGARIGTATYGRGNAGNITLQVRDTTSVGTASINAQDTQFPLKRDIPSAVFSSVEPGAIGQGGDVSLFTGSLSITNGAQIGTTTVGVGDAGRVIINANNDVAITGDNSGIVSVPAFPESNQAARGNSGGIQIRARSLQISDGAQLLSSTFSQGDAGKISIDVDDSVSLLDGAAIFSTISSSSTLNSQAVVGNSGGIEIRARSLSLTDSKIAASTFSQGDAGKISIDVDDSVSLLDGAAIFSTVSSTLDSEKIVGNSGGIEIQARSLSLSDRAKLATSTFGQGNAGNIALSIDGDIVLSGGESIRSPAEEFLVNPISVLGIGVSQIQFAASLSNAASTGVFSTVEPSANGNAGNINIQAKSLTLTNGAEVQSLTQGRGNAGTIEISATDFISASGVAPVTFVKPISGKPFLAGGFSSGFISSSESRASGQGGDIRIQTGTFSLSQGAVLSARTRSNFKGGDITVNADSLELTSGGQVLASTFSRGSAGNLTLNIADDVILSGTDPTFSARLQQFNSEIVDNDGSKSGLFSRSQGVGSQGSAAGQINLSAGRIFLEDGGTITTETTSGQGGAINLKAQQLLLLRRNSQISTTAGTAQQSGDGGNITINSPFIIALPNENSDISADAFSGRGGNVIINAQSIFGIQARSLPTLYSDITASSQLGVQGQISITEPNVQPEQGVVELPASILDASNQIAQACPRSPNARPLGEFTVTGRDGSLPPNPIEPLAGSPSLSPLASLDGDLQVNTSPQTSSKPALTATPQTIIEAQGWVKTASGKIALVASAPQATPNATTVQATCPVAK